MTCGRRRAVPRPRASRDDGDGARRDGPPWPETHVPRDGRAERPGVNPLIKSVMLQNDRRDDSDVAQLRRRVASSAGPFLEAHRTAGGRGRAAPRARRSYGVSHGAPPSGSAIDRLRPELTKTRRTRVRASRSTGSTTRRTHPATSPAALTSLTRVAIAAVIPLELVLGLVSACQGLSLVCARPGV